MDIQLPGTSGIELTRRLKGLHEDVAILMLTVYDKTELVFEAIAAGASGYSDTDELNIHGTNPNLADTDNDGLSDGAEVNTHGTLPKVADTDGDGFFDGYAVFTGKSPINDHDKPALVAEAHTAIEFTFSSAIGKTYRIEDSLDLTTWETVESGIAGNGAVIQRFYSTRGMPQRFFRVEQDGP